MNKWWTFGVLGFVVQDTGKLGGRQARPSYVSGPLGGVRGPLTQRRHQTEFFFGIIYRVFFYLLITQISTALILSWFVLLLASSSWRLLFVLLINSPFIWSGRPACCHSGSKFSSYPLTRQLLVVGFSSQTPMLAKKLLQRETLSLVICCTQR